MSDKPDWWPQCPYPDDIFTMSREDALKYLPTDQNLRTAVAGTLGRIFWTIASDSCWESVKDWVEDIEAVRMQSVEDKSSQRRRIQVNVLNPLMRNRLNLLTQGRVTLAP